MALNNTMALVDVVDFEVQKYGTRDVLFSVDYATKVGFKYDSEQLDIRGGISAPIRMSVNHSPTSEFSSELPLVDIGALAVKVGRTVTKSAVTVPKSEVKYVATSKISLSQTPLTSTLKVYVLEANGRDIKNELVAGTPATNATDYSIATKDITVNSAITAGTPIKVVYDYTSGANAKRLRVTSKDFPGYVRITGRGYALDESNNKSPVVFTVHRAKITPEFELTFEGGTATNIPFNAMIMPEKMDETEVFFDLVPLPDEAY